LPSKVYL